MADKKTGTNRRNALAEMNKNFISRNSMNNVVGDIAQQAIAEAAEEEERLKKEEEQKKKEEEERRKAEKTAKTLREQAEAQAKAEAEAKAKAEEEARLLAEEEQREKEEEEKERARMEQERKDQFELEMEERKRKREALAAEIARLDKETEKIAEQAKKKAAEEQARKMMSVPDSGKPDDGYREEVVKWAGSGAVNRTASIHMTENMYAYLKFLGYHEGKSMSGIMSRALAEDMADFMISRGIKIGEEPWKNRGIIRERRKNGGE